MTEGAPGGERALARLAASLAARPGAAATVPPGEPEPRRAAVAVVLHAPAGAPGPAAPGPSVLFVKRAEYPGDPWSGHVALPGGRAEPGDATLWDTAVRETREETGLDLLRGARPLGALDELYPRTPTLPPIVVRPYVVAVASPGELALSGELAGAFWAPLDALRSPEVDRESAVRVRGGRTLIVPSFVYAGHTIWGMTERVIRELLVRIG